MPTPNLEVSQLSIAFGQGAARVEVVKQANFRIGKGESYGLIGESGCGKSTILRAVAGLNPDYDGALLIDGFELPRRRSKEFFRKIQMVFQDPYASLHPRKMVQNVLIEPLQIISGVRRTRAA